MTLSITVVFPLAVSLIGLIMWYISPNAKVAETGRIMFWTGLLAFLLNYKSCK